MKIAIIGLGYVGLPLGLQFAESGVEVVGLDVDIQKVKAIQAGTSYIRHISSDKIKTHITSGKLTVSTDFKEVKKVDAILICVPTPLTKNREPDLQFITKTAESIAPHLSKGCIVILESTTYPGTTEGVLREILEKDSGLKAGFDFHLAFSPEREDPGNPNSRVSDIPKVVGGLTPDCLQKAKEVYLKAVKTVVEVSSCRAAEAAKLLENIFRSVNIALVNELKVVYEPMGIDIWEVIEAAKTKPFGFMAFYPGPGLGGHCIPIDPFYLTWKAREYGKHTRFIELAGEINTGMPDYVVSKTAEALNFKKKSMNGSRILVLGIAYKADVEDDRESASYVIMDKLKQKGIEVSYYDPHVPVIKHSREHAAWEGVKSITWEKETIQKFDAVLIATAHKAVNYQELMEWSDCIIDTRNTCRPTAPELMKKIWRS